MKKIRDLAPKPSDAVQAMVDGLRIEKKSKDFEIDMYTFLERKRAEVGVIKCFGCAAVVAVRHLTGNKYSPEEFGEGEDNFNRLCESRVSSVRPIELLFEDGTILVSGEREWPLKRIVAWRELGTNKN